MTENDVEIFYNHYKNSISAIDNAENRLLKCSYSFEKWSESLNEKSKIIRKLYAENDLMIKELIKIKAEDLEDALADKLITHIDFFISEGFRDYQVVVTILDELIEFYKKKGHRERLFDCYYFMASELIEVHEYEMACEYYRRALELYENPMECKEEYRQFKIMSCYYYRLVAAVCDKNASQNTVLAYYRTAYDIWVVNPIIDFMTPKKIRGIENILNTLPCVAIEKYLINSIDVNMDFFKIVEKEYNIQKVLYGDEIIVNTGIYVSYHKLRLYYGYITRGEYNNYICRKYNFEKQTEQKFSYGKSDFLELFDDEVLDEDFDVGKLFFMNPSYMYINSLIPEMIEIFRRNDFIDDIERYYMDFPIVSGDYLIDYLIEGNIKKLFKYNFDTDEILRIIDKVFINRQVVTLIHSKMVSKLASVITNRLISIKPELFVGQFGLRSKNAVIYNRETILNYIEKAGKVHDIGKIMCADIVNLQSRRISDREFAIIKKHPRRAADIIRFIPALRNMSDIALGHHKSYDGKKGYPDDFDNTQSEFRIFIDIIKICDCIDAATDFLGRNYAGAKDFSTVLKEFEYEKGTTYSDVIVDAIANDEYLIKSIEKITKEERQHTYYEIYHNMVEPSVSYRPDDEVFIRHYESADDEAICKMTGRTLEQQRKLISNCDNKAYVLVNGKQENYGSICLKDNGDTLEIVEIFIDKNKRKNGKGSMLLKEIERFADKQGFKNIIIPEIVEGHYDIFCWRNGYKKSDKKGFMVKTL